MGALRIERQAEAAEMGSERAAVPGQAQVLQGKPAAPHVYKPGGQGGGSAAPEDGQGSV